MASAVPQSMPFGGLGEILCVGTDRFLTLTGASGLFLVSKTYPQRGKRQSAVPSLLRRGSAAAGTAGRSTAGKSCRTRAQAAYPGIASACL